VEGARVVAELIMTRVGGGGEDRKCGMDETIEVNLFIRSY